MGSAFSAVKTPGQDVISLTTGLSPSRLKAQLSKMFQIFREFVKACKAEITFKQTKKEKHFADTRR